MSVLRQKEGRKGTWVSAGKFCGQPRALEVGQYSSHKLRVCQAARARAAPSMAQRLPAVLRMLLRTHCARPGP